MKNKKIGIIGGKGAMGAFFEHFFVNKGYTVFISDLNSRLTNIDVAKKSDVIFISVPLDITIDVIKEIAPFLNENQLLSDFSSLKEDIVNSMLKHSTASVIGTHPMFGPFIKNLKGQNIILCVGRDRNGWEKKLTKMFEKNGCNINKIDAKSHDENMALVQSLIHMLSIAIGRTMQKKNLHPLDLDKFSTPIFRLNSDLIGRLFNQDMSLYLSIIRNNKYTKKNIDIFMESFKEVQMSLLGEDRKKGMCFLENIKTFFNGFCKSAFNRSSKVLDAFFS